MYYPCVVTHYVAALGLQIFRAAKDQVAPHWELWYHGDTVGCHLIKLKRLAVTANLHVESNS